MYIGLSNLGLNGLGNKHPALTTVAQIISYYQGSWYDPSDLTTLWQDTGGTIPVAADGDPVALMMDKGPLGIHLTQATAGSRPTYKTLGGKSWITRDAIDDQLLSGATAYPTINYQHYLAMGGRHAGTTSASLFTVQKSATLFNRTGYNTNSRTQSMYRAASGSYNTLTGNNTWLSATSAVIDTQSDVGYLDVGVNGTLTTSSPAIVGTDSIGTAQVFDCLSVAEVYDFFGGIAIRNRLTASERAVIQAFLATKI